MGTEEKGDVGHEVEQEGGAVETLKVAHSVAEGNKRQVVMRIGTSLRLQTKLPLLGSTTMMMAVGSIFKSANMKEYLKTSSYRTSLSY